MARGFIVAGLEIAVKNLHTQPFSSMGLCWVNEVTC